MERLKVDFSAIYSEKGKSLLLGCVGVLSTLRRKHWWLDYKDSGGKGSLFVLPRSKFHFSC